MNRKNKYTIEIKFKNTESRKVYFDDKVSYPFSKSYKDHIIISNKDIQIEALRSGKVDLEGIFLNHQSALYRKITKSLIYYYCSISKPKEIKSIKTTHFRGDIINTHDYTENEITQIISLNCNLSILSNIDRQHLKIIFEENNKGHSFLFALTHFVKSQCIDNKFDSFEKKWKAFNAIYKQISGKSKDFECQVILRKNMIANPGNYPLVSSFVDNFTSKIIRDNTRWIKFIHNNYPNEKNSNNYKEFICRNDDLRLMEVFEETLVVREDMMKKSNVYDDIKNHIEVNLEKKIKNNIQLAATLCIKYMYFVRNKSIHAEQIDSGFRLIPFNKEENEVKWLSGILSLLTKVLRFFEELKLLRIRYEYFSSFYRLQK